MKNEIILTGKTVEEAMSEARRLYGTSDNELSFEILAMPKKGFLGFGAAPAKIKVTITKALEEVNLSDLVSELKNMKLTTDRDPEPQPKPRENRENRPANKGGNPNQKPRQEAKPQPKNEQKPRNPQPKQDSVKADSIKTETVKPQQPKTGAVKPQAAKTETVKTEAVQAEQPKKAEPAKELDESNLPAALRRPTKKNAAQEKPKAKKPQQSRPRDTRDEATKKKDLLSAVMGVAPAAPVAPAAAAAPAVSAVSVAPVAPAAPVEEPIVEAVEETTLSAAVDSALAQALADTAPTAMESLDGEDAQKDEAPAHADEPRLEFVTPAEMELALAFVNTLLANMELHVKAEASPAPEGVEVPEGMLYARVEIVGEDTGILIGHHGETLDSIQYLMNLSTIRKSGGERREFVKILLDVGNYREKREETLRTLARRTATRVVKYKRNFVLEPMNPYERRIIHSELHGYPDVSTHSVGSDENRKIVITYEGADKPKDNRRGRGDRNRRRGDRVEKSDRTEKTERTEKAEKSEGDRPRKARGDRPAKPVRAKSIDEIQIDLSSDSTKTFGSILADEGVETDVDPIEAIAREAEASEESLREY